MSKQSEAKAAQGYSELPSNCGNCQHRTFKMAPPAWMVKSGDRRATVKEYFNESQSRCGLGGFAVKKTASCGQHEFTEPA